VLEILDESTPVRDITLTQVDKLVEVLRAEDKANSTINRHLARLKTMLKHANSRGWISVMPTIEMLKEPPARLRYMSPAEETRMLGYFQYIGRDDMRDLVCILLDTGVRLSNACDLSLDQFDGSRITVRGEDAKGGKSYAVPATARVKDIMQRARQDGRTFVFPRLRSRHLARTLWDKAREVMGLTDDKNFVPHCCRHTFCSRLVQRGISITVVKELAGHADITMTMRYAHLRGQDLENAIAALEPEPGTKPEKELKIAN
jgi:integrase